MTGQIQGAGWIVRRVADLETQIGFYRDTIGLPLVRRNHEVAMFDLGEGTMLELGPGGVARPTPADRKEAPLALVLRVHGFDWFMDRFRAAGVPFVNEPFATTGGGRVAYIADPEGQVVGIQERERGSQREEDGEAFRRWDAR